MHKSVYEGTTLEVLPDDLQSEISCQLSSYEDYLVNKEKLSVFISFLLEERKQPILLLHKGERYDTVRIKEVLFSDIDEKAICPQCGSGCRTYYVVKADDQTISHINHWDGCMTFDPETFVESFDTMEELRGFLIQSNEDHLPIYKELFPVCI